jgi:cytochrome c oxidase subunit IV
MKIPRPPRRLVVVWLVLLVLLGGNTVLVFVGLGVFAPITHVAIAAMMAAMVLVVFMELDRGVPLFWVFAGAGFFWLAMLFVLTAADYLTRYSYAPTG